jgi:hypothetical protein
MQALFYNAGLRHFNARVAGWVVLQPPAGYHHHRNHLHRPTPQPQSSPQPPTVSPHPQSPPPMIATTATTIIITTAAVTAIARTRSIAQQHVYFFARTLQQWPVRGANPICIQCPEAVCCDGS